MINKKWLKTTIGFNDEAISIGDLAILRLGDNIKGTGVVLEVTPIKISLGLYCGPSPNNQTDKIIYDMVCFTFTPEQLQKDEYDLTIINPYLYEIKYFWDYECPPILFKMVYK